MKEQNIEEGIERFIRYIRRMNLLTDDQLRTVLNHAIVENPDSYGIGVDIDGHIIYIRNMAAFTDDQLKDMLRKSVDDTVMREIFEDAAKKKAIVDIQKMAKDMAKDIYGDPRKFARRVDDI